MTEHYYDYTFDIAELISEMLDHHDDGCEHCRAILKKWLREDDK